jgi:hypothetical protein
MGLVVGGFLVRQIRGRDSVATVGGGEIAIGLKRSGAVVVRGAKV